LPITPVRTTVFQTQEQQQAFEQLLTQNVSQIVTRDT
jgi:hypothetical protein